MILREMPDLRDERFRQWFYARWGRENCIISARTRDAEYPLYQQRLSIKAAWGGHESYFVDGRHVSVDDDTFMILNDGRTYGSRVRSTTAVSSFSIFFRPGFAADIARTIVSSPEDLLECDPERPGATEFSEHLRRHDRTVTPVLRYIHRNVEAGVDDEHWYEDQLYVLLHRMLALQNRSHIDTMLIPARRAGTRTELYRRVGLAVDFINTQYAQPIGLRQIAAAAHLSPYHCLRVFKSIYGKTPNAYLRDKRVQVAQRLLNTRALPLPEIAGLVGFQSRTTLFRLLKRTAGTPPSTLRSAGRCITGGPLVDK